MKLSDTLLVVSGLLLTVVAGCKKPPTTGSPASTTISPSRTLMQCSAGDYPIDASFSGDGKTLAVACTDKTVHLFDMSVTPAPRQSQPIALPLPIRHIALSPSGKLLAITLAPGRRPGSASQASCLRVLALGQMNDVIEPIVLPPDASFDQIAFSTDGNTLAVGVIDPPDHQRVEFLAMPSGQRKMKTEFQAPSAAPACVVFSPDNHLVAVSCGRVIHIINPTDGSDRSMLISAKETDAIASLSFSADSTTLATLTTDGNLTLWDAATEDKKRERPLSAATLPMPIAFSLDRKYLAVHTTGDALLLDAGSLKTEASLPGIDKPVTSFAFSPNELGMITTDQSGSVKWWEMGKN